MIEARNIDAFYGASHILHGVSLEVPDRGRVAVIGRNGAGKSTLLKALMNAGPTVKGEIRYNGSALGKLPAYKRARLGLQLVPEDRRIYEHLTVLENIRIAGHAASKERPPLEPQAVIERFPMLIPVRDRGGWQLSGGQQQMVAIARAMAARPHLLLLDEPTEGLAPAIVEELAITVRQILHEEQMGLLLCEQNIWFARQLTDRVTVMDAGLVAFLGTWAEFDANPEIKQRHLAI